MSEAAIDSFNDLSEVINEMETPEKPTPAAVVDVVASLPDALAPIPIVANVSSLPPPAPVAVPSGIPTAPTKVSKSAPSSATKLRKPVVKDKSTEVVTSKPVKSTVSRLSLGARASLGTSKSTPAAAVAVKPRFFLARLPRAVYAPLFSYFPLASLKALSGVNPEMYNMVNSHYMHWSHGVPDVTTQGLLSDALSKIQEKRDAARDALVLTGDVSTLIKVDDLRVLRTYRNPPPAVLMLSKAIVHLMSFAPPKGGVDPRALQGDWGVIKNQFLDLKCIVKALKASSDALAVAHPSPLPLTKQHLQQVVALAFAPELDEVKFKRICAALVPTLSITRKIVACLNAELRALELTQQYKRSPRDTTEADVQAIVSKLDVPVVADAQPEESPAPSPTGLKKPAAVSRLVKSSSSVKPKATTTKVEPKTAEVKPTAIRKVVPRVSTATATSRVAKSDDSPSSASSTPRSSIARAAATKTSDVKKPMESTLKKPVESTLAKTRTPLSARALPTNKAVLAKKASLSATDAKELKKATATTTSMATLRTDLEKATAELASQAQALELKAAEVAALTQANAALDTELKQVQEDLVEMRGQRDASQKEAESHHAALLEVKVVQETLQFRVDEMTQQAAAHATQVDVLTADAIAAVDALTAEKAALAAETTAAIDALVAEKAALVAELSNAQAKVAQS
ncbi:hypothetical protein As57867_011405, partial [Aphanomyces stellatus]